MRSRLFVLLSLLLVLVGSALGGTAPSEPVLLLPATIGKFRQVNPAALPSQPISASTAVPVATQTAEYVGNNGGRASIEIVRFRQDSQAYERLSLVAAQRDSAEILNNNVGTAGFTTPDEIVFFKGAHFVRIKNLKGSVANLSELAQALSETLDKGEGDIPVLVKHLPSPEEAQKRAIYLNGFSDFRGLPFQPAVLDAVRSGGNADAVFAQYGPSHLLIIEFNTPQLAAENDQRIISRIQELWKLGQPAPTAYRRIGNYSVFVFDAPDEQTAKQLIDQVKYEQVVQWLGENPNIFKEAEKRYINTTLGVLVAVLKASGFALITCLGMGGLIGALLFSYRRAQQRDVAAYSDAGGMLRLNLDEMTPETNPARLLRERN